MKKILFIILALLIATKVYADVRAYRLGSVGQDSLDGVRMAAASPTTTNYMTFESPIGTDLQVTSGYTFYITRIDLKATSSTNPCSVIIGYGDDGVANGAAAPTNWVAKTSQYVVVAGDSTQQFDVIIPIPSEKYPCALAAGVGNGALVNIYGIEVAN